MASTGSCWTTVGISIALYLFKCHNFEDPHSPPKRAYPYFFTIPIVLGSALFSIPILFFTDLHLDKAEGRCQVCSDHDGLYKVYVKYIQVTLLILLPIIILIILNSLIIRKVYKESCNDATNRYCLLL